MVGDYRILLNFDLNLLPFQKGILVNDGNGILDMDILVNNFLNINLFEGNEDSFSFLRYFLLLASILK